MDSAFSVHGDERRLVGQGGSAAMTGVHPSSGTTCSSHSALDSINLPSHRYSVNSPHSFSIVNSYEADMRPGVSFKHRFARTLDGGGVRIRDEGRDPCGQGCNDNRRNHADREHCDEDRLALVKPLESILPQLAL